MAVVRFWQLSSPSTFRTPQKSYWDDSGISSSDETGLFSSAENEDGDGDAPLLIPDRVIVANNQIEDRRNYYLTLDPTSLLDPFQINFEELTDHIVKVGRISLSDGGRLVSTAVLVLRIQVNSLQREVQAIYMNVTRLNQRPTKNSSNTDPSTLSNSPKPPNKEDACQSAGLELPRKRKYVNMVAEEEKYISLQELDYPPDIVSRKRRLLKKFEGLAKDSLLYYEFNIHETYQSEYLNPPTMSSNLNAASHFLQLRKRGTAHGVDMEKEMGSLKFLSMHELECGVLSEEDLAQTDNGLHTSESEHGQTQPVTQQESINCSDENMDISLSSENIPIVFNGMMEADIPQGLHLDKRKRSIPGEGRKRRAVLELRNETTQCLSVDNLYVPVEFKLGQENQGEEPRNGCIFDENSPQNSVNHQDSGYVEEDPEILDLQNAEVLNDSQLDVVGDIRIPSPWFADDSVESIHSRINFTNKTTQTDIKELIQKMDQTIEAEIKKEQRDMTFEELVMKSGIPITGATSVEVSSSQCTKSEVSIHMAFLATLHSAVHNKLYLVNTDRGSFKVTKERPICKFINEERSCDFTAL